ncbi:MAG: hypothetical protein F082_1884 [bacterium F082]|nr:MAG: hypothetical protein F082_1884 [bacterium F082]KWW27441.1 MAG: hypothetical protein AUK64_2188 [bacterium P201]
MKRFLILFGIICGTITVHAQNYLSGVVYDTLNDTILPFAEIHIFPQDTVVYSDTCGFFRFPTDNIRDSLSVVVKYIGYYDCALKLPINNASSPVHFNMIPRILDVDTFIHPIRTMKFGIPKVK